MPPRKKHYFHGRRRGEPPKDNQREDVINQQIRKSKHPFEESGFISKYTLTPSQKAITCAINMNNGSASEPFLLKFLHDHWKFIGKMNTKLPNNIPDSRILHINLAVKKRGIPLFIHSPDDNEKWILNTSTSLETLSVSEDMQTDKQETTTDDTDASEKAINIYSYHYPRNREVIKDFFEIPSGKFETLVLDELKKYKNPININDLAEKIPSDKPIPGLFTNMPHIRRTRAALIMLKQYGKCIEEKGLWKYKNEDGKNSVQNELHKAKKTNDEKEEEVPDISKISVSEFYEMVRNRK